LAVTPGNTDLATSESIKIAKEVDPDGKHIPIPKEFPIYYVQIIL